MRYDAIIIGAGQSGPAIGTTLAKDGARVVIVEGDRLGGTCLNYGCMPTKSLRASARVAHLARRGAARQVELAEVLGVSPASLSDSVASLLRKGLVERRPEPADRRARRVVLTEAGRTRIEALPEAPVALVAALAALAPAEAGAVLRALTRIIRELQEAHAIPAQRLCVTCRHFRPHAHADAERPHHCAFVDAAFGDADLRLDCGEHEEAGVSERARNWARLETAA